MDSLVIIEETNTGFSAYAPDLPGCIATGKTRDAQANARGGRVSYRGSPAREASGPGAHVSGHIL